MGVDQATAASRTTRRLIMVLISSRRGRRPRL